MADSAAEKGRPEVEEAADAVLDVLSSQGIASIVDQKEVTNDHILDQNRDANISNILDFDDGTSSENETMHESREEQVETGESSQIVGEVLEEEVVELEFEKVKPKLDTHTMHCPNCKSEVTKVILRRKLYNYRPVNTPVVAAQPPVVAAQPPVVAAQPEPEPEPKGLLGCLSCLCLFTRSDDGCFNPFDIFGHKPETVSVASPPSNGDEIVKPKLREQDNCFSMFWVPKDLKQPEDPKSKEDQVYDDGESINADQVQPLKLRAGTKPIAQGNVGTSSGVKNTLQAVSREPIDLLPTPSDVIVEVGMEPEVTTRGRPWFGYDGILAEILKSIVYGGLMEVIASLSIVASAASSDAATLSIVALALASLVGGILVIAHNLWDLRNDCYNETKKEATSKYKELLGQVNYFPLHAFFAILSFIVFGMVPPVAYGYAFNETNDKDYTLVVVATASLVCVGLLAIFKAYINKCMVFDYFKTVVYYIITAVSASGVSYVVGNLITRLMEEYGLFDTNSGGGVSLGPHATIPSFVSF